MSPLGGSAMAVLERPRHLIGIAEDIFDVTEQRWVVVFKGKQVVSVMFTHRPGNVLLTAHSVGRDHCARWTDDFEQLRNDGDLVGLFRHLLLAEHYL